MCPALKAVYTSLLVLLVSPVILIGLVIGFVGLLDGNPFDLYGAFVFPPLEDSF